LITSIEIVREGVARVTRWWYWQTTYVKTKDVCGFPLWVSPKAKNGKASDDLAGRLDAAEKIKCVMDK
jgi:hypothetical protein